MCRGQGLGKGRNEVSYVKTLWDEMDKGHGSELRLELWGEVQIQKA